MKSIQFTIVQLAITMALGIVTAYYVVIPIQTLFLGILVGSIVSILCWLTPFKPIASRLFTFCSWLLFFFIGFVNFQLHQPTFQQYHFEKFNSRTNTQVIHLKIKEVLKPSIYQDKYIAKVEAVDSNFTKGLVLVNIVKDSLHIPLKIDDALTVISSIRAIRGPSNPEQFNYKKYMEHLSVFYEINCNRKDIVVAEKTTTSLRGIAEKTRNFLITKLQQTPIGFEERAITQALLLGQKRDISIDLRESYAQAGALHILAVSGLHVGILLWIFSWVLRPLERLRYGKPSKAILLMLLLWSFAFLAGLSPSVVRAVCMFSFFAMASGLKRPTNSFNTLFLSFFVLLIFKPLWIFHVGFQLSYLAVFFILWVQPKLSRLHRPDYKITKILWDVLTVSFAAQLGIAPLSVFYFHQFPGLFFLTNIVILPLLGILLGFGIVIIVLSAINGLPDWLATFYNSVINTQNNFIKWVAQQESFVFENISISLLQMLSLYLVIICSVFWWKTYKKSWVFSVLSSIIVLLFVFLSEKHRLNNELVLFHKTKKTWMAITEKDSIKLYKNDTLDLWNETTLKNYVIAKNKPIKIFGKLPSVFSYEKDTFVVIDSIGIYPKTKNAIIILTDSPKLNLQRLIDSLQPKLIIANGSNYKNYVMRWNYTCLKNNQAFYYTGEKGAYTVE